jgi:hypothetical protein
MYIETVAHQTKLGLTTYRAQFFGDNGHDAYAYIGKTREYESFVDGYKGFDLAKDWIARELKVLNREPRREITWWARIDKGIYVEDILADFRDTIYDASWEIDEDFNWDSSELES